MGSKGKRKNSKKPTGTSQANPAPPAPAAATPSSGAPVAANYTSSPPASSAPSVAGSTHSSPKLSQAQVPTASIPAATEALPPTTPLNQTVMTSYGSNNNSNNIKGNDNTTHAHSAHAHDHNSHEHAHNAGHGHSHCHGLNKGSNDNNNSSSSSSSSLTQDVSPALRPSTPPPIACKGVLITSESAKNKKKLVFVTCLCLCFFALELIGGYYAQSLALISDAFHLLSDVVSFIVSLAAIWLAEQPATKRHSFGYHRAEVLAALISVFIIWILTGVLFLEAIERIRNPVAIDGKAMSIVAVIGVGVNIVYEVNINIKAATLHVIGDLISSVGVLVASVIIIFKPTWTLVDPICTIFFSILVMFTTYRLVWDSLGILMEGTPTHIDPEEVEEALRGIEGVAVVHDLHVWNLTVGKPALAVHLQLRPFDVVSGQMLTMEDYERILTEAQNMVCGRFQIHHSTIQLETHSTTPSEHCRPGMCQDGITQTLRGMDAV
ncbi:hypothetical protein BGZ73_002429 [Actinomortierella ambigua]|nr:hypothetical protein BGZ73_002429 [Actinomortierella ambigua]